MAKKIYQIKDKSNKVVFQGTEKQANKYYFSKSSTERDKLANQMSVKTLYNKVSALSYTDEEIGARTMYYCDKKIGDNKIKELKSENYFETDKPSEMIDYDWEKEKMEDVPFNKRTRQYSKEKSVYYYG